MTAKVAKKAKGHDFMAVARRIVEQAIGETTRRLAAAETDAAGDRWSQGLEGAGEGTGRRPMF